MNYPIDMNVQAEKLGLIEWIARLNDTVIIKKLMQLHEAYEKKADWWNEISDSERESIEKGLKDIDKGKVHSHDTVRKLYENS